MLGCVGEGGGVLWSCVLWPVRGGVTDHHQHWPVRIDFLGHAEVTDAVVGYQVCQIVLGKEQEWAYLWAVFIHFSVLFDAKSLSSIYGWV